MSADSNPYITRDAGGWTINPPDMQDIWLSVNPATASDTVLSGLNAKDQYQAAVEAAATTPPNSPNSSPNNDSNTNTQDTMANDRFDINDDGQVNSGDVQALSSNIRAGGGTDLNDDGVVNMGDVQTLFREIASRSDDVATGGSNGGGGSGSASPSPPSNFEGELPGPDSGSSSSSASWSNGALAGLTDGIGVGVLAAVVGLVVLLMGGGGD